MSGFRLSATDAAALERVVRAVSADFTLLHEPALASLKQLVLQLGGQIPPPRASAPAADASPPRAAQQTYASAAPSSPSHQDFGDVDLWVPEHGLAASPTGEDSTDEAAHERAAELKSAAQGAAADGNFDEAIRLMTEALHVKPSSSMWWALRADFHLQAKKPVNAIHDASEALKRNEDSWRALRVRGRALRHLGRWEESRADLNRAQQGDYDDSIVAVQKLVNDRHQAEVNRQREAEIAAEERQREEAAARAAASAPPPSFGGGGAGGFGGGLPPGMPPGAAALFEDPEFVAAMQNPRTAAKIQQLMSNPAAALQMMGDPDVGPLLQKMMMKFGGGMGGGGGAPGGMGGGFPGMGGMGGGFPGMGGMGGGFPGGDAAPPQAAPPKPARRDDLD